MMSPSWHWFTEAGADVAGKMLGGHSKALRNHVLRYLAEDKPLTARAYDAYGVHGLLLANGVNMLAIFEQMMNLSAQQDLYTSFIQLVPHDALKLWPMSLMRKPEWGPEWDLGKLELNLDKPEGMDIPPPRLKEVDLTAGNSAIRPLPKAHPQLFEIKLPQDRKVRIKLRDAVGGIRNSNKKGGASESFTGEATFDVCTGKGCSCNNDKEGGAKDLAESPDGIVVLAVLTLKTNAPGAVEFEVLPACCAKEETQMDQRLVGKWRMDLASFKAAREHVGSAERRAYNLDERVEIEVRGDLIAEITKDGRFVKSYIDLQETSRMIAGPTSPVAGQSTVQIRKRLEGIGRGCFVVQETVLKQLPSTYEVRSVYEETSVTMAEAVALGPRPRVLPYQGSRTEDVTAWKAQDAMEGRVEIRIISPDVIETQGWACATSIRSDRSAG